MSEKTKFQSKQTGLIAQPREGVRRVWLNVELGALLRNFLAFTSLSPQTKLLRGFSLEVWVRNCFPNHTMLQAFRTSVYYLKTERTSGWVVRVGVGPRRGGMKQQGDTLKTCPQSFQREAEKLLKKKNPYKLRWFNYKFIYLFFFLKSEKSKAGLPHF